jgi:hypothetical protein
VNSRVVLIAGAGEDGERPGLFASDGEHVERLDAVATLSLSFDGTRLFRLVSAAPNQPPTLVVYDAHGVVRALRLTAADTMDVGDVASGLTAPPRPPLVAAPEPAWELRDGDLVISTGTGEPMRVASPLLRPADVAVVTPEIVDGIRCGLDVNPTRTADERQLRRLAALGCEHPRMLWPTGHPLPWGEFACTVEAKLPAHVVAGTTFEQRVCVTNRSSSFFVCAAPAPVYVSYKWLDARGDYLDDARAHRTRLPRTIFPGESLDVDASVVVPERCGSPRLRVTLMQEGVAWFDDLDPRNGVEAAVEITASLGAETDAAPALGTVAR